VLDLLLPVRDGGIPQTSSGTELLHDIVAGHDLKKPTHILCLTEYPDQASVFDSQILLSLTHIVKYEEGSSHWRQLLIAKCKYISERLASSNESPSDFYADLVIITSSPICELTEVLKLDPSFIGEFHHRDALHYYLTKWKSATGKPLQVVACAAPQMGMTAACATASKVIERWRPRLLAMCGIAAGTKNDLRFGDILVGEIVYDYGSGKISDTASGVRVLVPDPRPLTMDVQLKAVLQLVERTQSGVSDFMTEWHGLALDWTPRVILGVIASGSAVVQSRSLVDEVLMMSRKTVGLEMEAYGVFQAAVLCCDPHPKVLIAKSVADFADHSKSDNWQQLAAFTSARFVHSFVTTAKDLIW
jgi:nucleoside phosphorylase